MTEKFGALPFIFGTAVSSLIALVIAVPLSIATALFNRAGPALAPAADYFADRNAGRDPQCDSRFVGNFCDDSLAAGLSIPVSEKILGWTPFFSGPIYGVSMLAGGIIIAIMILPIITSVSREILRSVPNLQREAAYALGATRWEVTRIAVFSYAKKGLFGAVILGLGRALGETMAVTMVIGNTPQIAASLFDPGYTLASVLANEFTEATTDLYLSALFELALVLLGVTILVNLLAQLMVRTIRGRQRVRSNKMNETIAQSHLPQIRELASAPRLFRASCDRAAWFDFVLSPRKGASSVISISSPASRSPPVWSAAAWAMPLSALWNCSGSAPSSASPSASSVEFISPNTGVNGSIPGFVSGRMSSTACPRSSGAWWPTPSWCCP